MKFYVVLADNRTHEFKALEYIASSAVFTRDNLTELLNRAKDFLDMLEPVVISWTAMEEDATPLPFSEEVMTYLRKAKKYTSNEYDAELQALTTNEAFALLLELSVSDISLGTIKTLFREIYSTPR